MNDVLIKLLIPLLQQFLASVSPVICQELKSFARELWNKAQETSNPWDNVLASLLYAILGMETPNLS